MHENIILNNGLTMPTVGFGTWMLKGETGKQAIREALSVGYRLIDTAHMYDNEAIVNQVECHVYYRRKELQQALVTQGTQMQAWSPFTEGKKPIFQEPILQAVGEKYGKTAAQIALQYLVQQGIGVIPKSSHRERMVENLDIFDVTLTPDDMARIQQLETGKTLFGWYED